MVDYCGFPLSLSPVLNQSEIQAALRCFLLSVLSPGIEIVEGQDSRVPEPIDQDFVVLTPIRRTRLATNIDTFADCVILAAINGPTLTVENIETGKIAIGTLLWSLGILHNTQIIAQTLGLPGGTGTYTLNQAQNVGLSRMACGQMNCLQKTDTVVQIDIHGPNGSDNAQVITTLLRDESGLELFRCCSPYDVTPLHADDPKQIPFVNAEQQFEDRWIVEAHLQANQIVAPPQQYFDKIGITLVEADVLQAPLPPVLAPQPATEPHFTGRLRPGQTYRRPPTIPHE